VGTRNISDYKEHMSENIDENVPALMYALSEVNNYKKEDILGRVEHFIATDITSREVKLDWNYIDDETLYFEIYRSTQAKGFAQASNRIAKTKLKTFTDKNLSSSTNYWYFIRAVCKKRNIKSPFGQKIGVRTQPAENMFSKILYPVAENIGYVGEKTKKNSEHFGTNSLFVGYSEQKGECLGVCGFSLKTIPENAIITSASISFYPMNRVSVQVESYGEWRVGQIDERTIDKIDSFDDIKNAKSLSYIDRPTGSAQLAQGVWRSYKFASQEIDVLQKSLKRREAYFKMQGPSSLPLDRASQMMQWDIGYGKYSGGLTYRPKLDISYTINEARIDLQSSSEITATKEKIIDSKLRVGYSKDGDKEYGCIEFDLSNLPDMDNTVISSAYIDIEANKISSQNGLRFHIEMIIPCEGERTYEKIKNRDIIERIGYDVSIVNIKESPKQRFVFDKHAISEMLVNAVKNPKAVFVISASSQTGFCKSQSVDWMDSKKMKSPSLIINYLKKRRTSPAPVKNLTFRMENGLIKLEWNKSEDDACRGYIVVKNAFRVPCTAYDGQKLYGGSDTYTFDNFGDKNTHKYYAVFSYDDVPNFSNAVAIEVNK